MNTESKTGHTDYAATLRELIGEESFQAILSTVERRADELVSRNKKEMTEGEREEFRAQCLRKAAWEKLCEYSVEATRPKAFTKSWWKDVLPRAGVYSVTSLATTIGGFLLFSKISSRGAHVVEETPAENTETHEQTTESPFRATARPSRRAANTENISAL
jgi:hypothetical protein